MDIVCCIIWIILCIVSIAWSILPWLPWPQLAYVAIILAQFFMNQPFTRGFIILWWILMVLLIILDYYLPILWTKKFWGSKRWNWWCIVGMVIWLFAWPVGLVLGPFAWALVGEYLHQSDIHKSIKPAFGAFIWFASGVLLKLIASIILFIYFLIWCYNHFFLTLDSFSIWTDALTSLL